MAQPTLWVKLAAAANPFDSAPVWTDITTDVREVSWSRGRSSALDEVGPGSGSLRLKNADRHFEPGFAGPYTPLRVYRPVNIGLNWSGTDYSLAYMFAETWNANWDVNWGSSYAETEVQLVDAIALLNMTRILAAFPLQETASVRIGRVLDAVTFPAGMRSLSGGSTVKAMLAWPAVFTTAWEHIQACVRSSSADRPCYVDRRGYVMYSGTTASGLTFGDNIPTELKYTAASLNYGADLVFNRAEVTAEGGVAQAAQDLTSQGRYRMRTLSRSTLNTTDTAALSMANSLVTQYKEPRARLEGFQVKPGGTTALWNAVITLDLEHTITVNRRPPGGGTMFTQTPKIVGLNWTLTPTMAATVITYTLTGSTL